MAQDAFWRSQSREAIIADFERKAEKVFKLPQGMLPITDAQKRFMYGNEEIIYALHACANNSITMDQAHLFGQLVVENPELATAKPESKAAMSALIEKEVKRKRAVEAAHFMAGARLAGWTGGAVVTRDDAALLAGHMAAGPLDLSSELFSPLSAANPRLAWSAARNHIDLTRVDDAPLRVPNVSTTDAAAVLAAARSAVRAARDARHEASIQADTTCMFASGLSQEPYNSTTNPSGDLVVERIVGRIAHLERREAYHESLRAAVAAAEEPPARRARRPLGVGANADLGGRTNAQLGELSPPAGGLRFDAAIMAPEMLTAPAATPAALADAPPPAVPETLTAAANVASLPLTESQDSLAEAVDATCLLCLTAVRSVVYIPCKHLAVCELCAIRWSAEEGGGRCPCCRTDYTDYTVVFMA